MTPKGFMPVEGRMLIVSTHRATTDRARGVKKLMGAVKKRGSGLRAAIPVLMCYTSVRRHARIQCVFARDW